MRSTAVQDGMWAEQFAARERKKPRSREQYVGAHLCRQVL